MRRAAEEESEKKVDEEQVVWYGVVMKDGESKKYKISMVNGTTFTVNINSSDDDYGDCDQVISDAMKKEKIEKNLVLSNGTVLAKKHIVSIEPTPDELTLKKESGGEVHVFE